MFAISTALYGKLCLIYAVTVSALCSKAIYFVWESLTHEMHYLHRVKEMEMEKDQRNNAVVPIKLTFRRKNSTAPTGMPTIVA